VFFFSGTASNPSTPSPVRKIIVQGGATSGLLTNNGMMLESEGGDGGDGGDGGEGGEGGEGEGTTGSTASSHRRPEETPERLKRVVSMKNFEMLKVLGKGSYGKVILVRKTDGEDVGKKYTSHVRVLLPLSNVLIPLDCSLFWFSGSLSLCLSVLSVPSVPSVPSVHSV